MQAIKVILTRRSVRKYADESVSSEDEALILKAAMTAPYAIAHAREYIVVRNPATPNGLPDCLHPNGLSLRNIPMAVVVSGDMRRNFKERPEYWAQDTPAASTGICLLRTKSLPRFWWLGASPPPPPISNHRKSRC